MTAITFAQLGDRGLLGLGGADAREFLQNLVSNDVGKLGPNRALYALLLTPQGKYLFDFFMAELADDAAGTALVLDCEAARIEDLQRKLAMYTLRADVTLADLSDLYAVAAAFGEGAGGESAGTALGLGAEAGNAAPFSGGAAFVDPRLSELGARVIAPKSLLADALMKSGFAATDAAAYDRLRLSLGVPDSSRDIPVDKGFPLEAGLGELNAIDYGKGCYVGQELTARTHYRGTIRKRLFRVDVDGVLPEPGTPVLLGDVKAGEMRSGADGLGIVMLRLEHVAESENAGTPFTAGGARLTAVRPPWFGAEPGASGSAEAAGDS